MGGGMDGNAYETSRRLRGQRELECRQPEVERQRLEARRRRLERGQSRLFPKLPRFSRF